jgi:hypothetical protein
MSCPDLIRASITLHDSHFKVDGLLGPVYAKASTRRAMVGSPKLSEGGKPGNDD